MRRGKLFLPEDRLQARGSSGQRGASSKKYPVYAQVFELLAPGRWRYLVRLWEVQPFWSMSLPVDLGSFWSHSNLLSVLGDLSLSCACWHTSACCWPLRLATFVSTLCKLEQILLPEVAFDQGVSWQLQESDYSWTLHSQERKLSFHENRSVTVV